MHLLSINCPECGKVFEFEGRSQHLGKGHYELSVDTTFVERTLELHYEQQHPDAPEEIEVSYEMEIDG